MAGLVAGFIIVVIGALVSLAAGSWQILFAICTSAALIAIVISSMMRNITIVLNRGAAKKNTDQLKVIKENEGYAKAIIMFSIPNVITAIILYFKLYK